MRIWIADVKASNRFRTTNRQGFACICTKSQTRKIAMRRLTCKLYSLVATTGTRVMAKLRTLCQKANAVFSGPILLKRNLERSTKDEPNRRVQEL
mmetsp:Transcript_42132/g.90504  ORF Transcript_42132/g.90504 Transcript_42132/m.90504 type:complete len:95 (-) Transcript_42132:1409-1693(-)